MGIEKVKPISCRKIAAVLVVSMCLQILAPTDNSFAAYTSTETETHNKANQKLGSYETTGYWVKDPNGGSDFFVPVHKETETVGNKVLTTNSLDMDWIRENEDDLGIDLDDFIQDDGNYKFDAEIQYDIVIDNKGTTVPVVGQDSMLAAPEIWGGSWSQKTKNNILDEDNSICEGTYYYPGPTPVPATPIPTTGPSPSVISVTPIPTNMPTVVPITDVPATPLPTPEVTSLPTPVATPAPQIYNYFSAEEYTKYYSSTNGHSISDITVNGKIADDTGVSVISLADALANVGTRKSYDVGTDTQGNEWYVIKSDTQVKIDSAMGKVYTCSYVHPKTYNGYDVDSPEVRFISELTFPEYVTIGSRRYYVRSIGGSGPYYYAEPASKPSGTVNSSIGTFKGKYDWKSGSNTCGFTYQLGVVGNGSITSYGLRSNTVVEYDTYIYKTSYNHNYHVYNTTLTGITVPAYCIKIEDYAFYNCQALLVINNNKVTTIGAYAFYVSEVPKLQRSQIYSSEYGTVRRIFSYDDSYVSNYKSDFTPVMYEFQRLVEIGPHMNFPSLSVLATIGESAFENRSHLKKVGLYSTVKTIGSNAFKNCTLDQISVPGAKTEVYGDQETLGTKGRDVLLKTIIVTPKNSLACQYGNKYDDYYRLMQEAYITYMPNGGLPIAGQTEMAEVKYIDATFTDQFYVMEWANSGSISREAIWRGEEGMIYYARPSGTKIQGGPVDILKDYRFDSLEQLDVSPFYYVATMKNGESYLIKAKTSSTKITYSLCKWNAPVECASVVIEQKGKYEIYKVTGEDGRYHWNYNGTWTSEPEWPGEVSQVAYASQNIAVTDSVSITTTYHKTILCKDGSVYTRASRNSAWLQVPGTYIGINSGGTYVYTAKDETYYNYQKISISGTNAVLDSRQYQTHKTSVAFAGALDRTTAAVTTTTIAGETLQYVENSFSDIYTTAKITQQFPSKKITLTISKYDDGSTEKEDFYLGYNELIAARISTNSKYFAYYVDDSGRLCRIGNVCSSGVVSNVVFKKVIVLNSQVAPIGDWTYYNSYTCGTEGCSGHLGETSTVSQGINGTGSTNGGTPTGGYATVCMAALDVNGQLWYGEAYYNPYSGGGFSESFKPYDSNRYTDILNYKISTSSGDGDSDTDDSTGTTTSWSEQESRTMSYFYALDSNKDVWSFSFKSFDEGTYYRSTSSPSSHKDTSSSSAVHYRVTDFKLTDMNYAEDVEKFIKYPFLMFTTEEPGLLTTNKCTLDIFCGVEVVYDISENKWFEKEGYDFTHWNAAADNTGKEYQAGERIRKMIYSTSWSGAAEDLTLYAQWETARPKPKYIHYDANGGYGTMEATVVPVGSDSFVVSENAFSKVGHAFAGYFTEHADGTGTKYYPGRTMTADKNYMILYAQWVPNTYTVEFAYDDFRVVPPYIFDRVKLTFTRSIAMPMEPYKKLCIVDYDLNTNSSMSTAASAEWTTPRPFTEEYTTARLKFLGWDKYYFKNNTYIKANERFEEWEEVSGLSTVNDDVVTMFPVWGGIDGHVLLPGAVCNGYELYGWMDAPKYEDTTDIADYIYENGGGMYVPKASETLYAWWAPLEYEVKLVSTFEGNPPDTTGDTTVTMTFDAECPAVTAPTLERYVFAGYYTEPDGKGEQYYGRADKTTGKAGTYEGKLWQIYDGSVDTLYAYWVPEACEVILDDRGATSTDHTEMVQMIFEENGPDIIVPEKTGYVFQGYYTGIRGAGTKYYDENGVCIKPWMERNVYVLYACWIQDEVKFPEEGEYTEPEVPQQTEVEGLVERTDAKGLLYADDYDSSTDALTDLQPYLAYDTSGTEGAIPGTENVAIRAKMGSWILKYKFHRCSGIDMVRIYVAVPYCIQYEDPESEELVISDVMTKTYEVIVPKKWSYWEVAESGMYYPDDVEIKNEALKEQTVTIKVDREGSNAVVVPSYTVEQYGEKEEHVVWNDYDADGMPVLYIILTEPEYIISNVPGKPPEIDRHLSTVCENAARSDNRQAKVRSDKYEFGGEMILSDAWNDTGEGAPLQTEKLPTKEDIKLTSYLQNYRSGIELNEEKPNKTYGTTAVITYVGDENNIGVEAVRNVELSDINAIRIHTPVACNGVALDGIEEGIITLKHALNFFTLRIDNVGTHRMSLGYGTKDFAFALSGRSNVAAKKDSYLNQVRFPFEVYVDVGNDSLKENGTYDTTGDFCVAADTWITIGMEEQRFFIPVTQKNGTYKIDFRTIATNCPDTSEEHGLDEITQSDANVDCMKYIVTDSMEIKIRSYLEDFIITDTNDPTASRLLQKGMQALTLKKGYEFSYQVLTQGEFYGDTSEIEIIPSYFWESEDGTKRQKVILYHMEEIPKNEWMECYAWDGEPILKRYETWKIIRQRWGGSGFVPEEVLCVAEDSEQGICLLCKKRQYVSGGEEKCELCGAVLQELQPFSLEEYAKVQTLTGKEKFFKQDGYLIIHFKIRVKSEEGIWYFFDNWENTKLSEDALAAGWNYEQGDVIRYDLSKSCADDLEVGGLE